MATPLLVRGMHGLGDNIHQRAIIRALLKRDYCISLETAWPCVYWDLAGENLRFLPRPAALRAQLKNAVRERAKFSPPVPPHHPTPTILITYGRDPCACSGMCHKACTKLIDMPSAKAAVAEFILKLCVPAPVENRPASEMFTAPAGIDGLLGFGA